MTRRQRQDEEHRLAVEAYYATQDETLLGPVLEELRPRLKALLWSKGLRDSEERDDVVQDALASMLLKLRAGEFRFAGSVASWAAPICYGRYIDLLRNKANGITTPGPNEDPFLLLGEAAAEPPQLLSEKEEAEAKARLLLTIATQAVLDLDVNARACVVLAYYHSYSNADAAAQLGITESTFRTRLSRALDELRAWGKTIAPPTLDVFAAVRRVNTGDLFRDPLLTCDSTSDYA